MSASGSDPKIVRKTGEGFDRPTAQAELPIDINYQKLSEWLVQRQKLPADWHKRLQAIQSKITEAVKELPAGLLAALLGSTEAAVDYFAAVKVRDRLAETGERTLFGGLTGQAGVWDKIVRAYENGGVFIGEAAQTMVQNVDYEIPYLRKQMAKCTQQMADADRRHAEYTRSAETCAVNYKKECEKMGITGQSVGQELKQLTNKLPALFEQLVTDLRSPDLNHIVNYYQHFTQYAHGGNDSSRGGPTQQQAEQQQLPDVLHTLMEIREQRTVPYLSTAAADNNTAGAGTASLSMMQWGSVVDPELINSSMLAPAEIDWGVGADTSSAAAPTEGFNAVSSGISWDLGDTATAATTSADAGGGISWDVAAEPEAAGNEAAASGGPTLDWDIDISGIGVEDAGDSSAAAPTIHWDLDVAAGDAAGPSAGTASTAFAGGDSDAAGNSRSSDASADRLQHDSDYRSQLLDDLQELRAFLVSRRAELSGSSSSSNLLRALAPDAVSAVDGGDVERMLKVVDHLLAAMNDEKLKQLLMMSSSSRYMERLQNSLLRKAGQEAKMLTAAAETQARKHEARATLANLQPKLSELLAHTRSIKVSVEAALSKQFNGRRVNVLGEINNALAGAA